MSSLSSSSSSPSFSSTPSSSALGDGESPVEREHQLVKIDEVRARSATVMDFFLLFFSFFFLHASENERVANLVEYTRPTGVSRLVSAKCSWKFGRDTILVVVVVVGRTPKDKCGIG